MISLTHGNSPMMATKALGGTRPSLLQVGDEKRRYPAHDWPGGLESIADKALGFPAVIDSLLPPISKGLEEPHRCPTL